MTFPLPRLLGILTAVLGSALSIAHSQSTSLPTPLQLTDLDPAAFVQWVDGAERPILKPNGSPSLPQDVIATQTTVKSERQKFGDSKTPGPRYLRIGFLQPVEIGTVLANGDVALSVLKPDAAYPGDLGDDSQWIPAERLGAGAVTSDPAAQYQCAAWLLPPGTQTRALRFTHIAQKLDKDFTGLLQGVRLLSDRWINVAPQAVAVGRTSRQISKINNDLYDGWFAWENIDGKTGTRPHLIADDPEWLLLVWPEPVVLRGTSLWWVGFGAAEIETYVGPENTAPLDAPEKAWLPLATLTGLSSHGTPLFAMKDVDFGRDVTTRALRLRLTATTRDPGDRDRNGTRVWLGEWLAWSPLQDRPLSSVRPVATDSSTASAQGVIPVRFSLPEDGFVTLVIDNAQGVRVRNLISETPFKAGEHTVGWDGSDDLGRDGKAAQNGVYSMPFQPVPPGQYHVHGLWRKAVVPTYEFSTYAPGTPPWSTDDHTGGWVANHSPPQAAVFVPGDDRSPTREPLVYLGCLVTEGPDAVAWVDLDGRKRGGRKWIGGTWTGAPFMAHDSGSKFDPAVSVYVGTSWKDEKVKNSSLLRLNTLTPDGDSKPVLNVDLGTLPTGTNMSEALRGFSARDSQLVCSLVHLNELLFVNATPGVKPMVSGRMPLESPRGSAFDSQGRFLVLSGSKLLRYPGFPSADSRPETLIAQGLEDPQSLALDADGNFYVSDWGGSHQVKVFSPVGKFLRVIGTPGSPQAGPYDREHLNHPWGIAIDSKNQLWVAEHDQLPRRVSVWSLDGKLVRAFYGPGKYGGGGALDPQDKTRFYYAQEGAGAMEFRLDWEKGTSEPASVYYRTSETSGFKLPSDSAAPETPIDFQGRRYFSNAYNSSPTSGTTTAFLFQERGGLAYPVAGMGWAMRWSLLTEEPFRSRWPEGVTLSKSGELPTTVFFVWVDANGDAEVQPEEVQMTNADSRGVTVMPDLSFCVSNMGGTYPATFGKTVRFVPTRFDERGIPHYDLANGQVLAENVKFSGGSQVLTDDSGWTVVTLGIGPFLTGSLSGAKDGVPRWSYPNLWPGLHAGQKAPRHSFPGQVIGSTRLLGGFFKVGPETLWAVNSDQGGPYVFTRDGLFVATLFEDVRLGKSWRMPAAERGTNLKGITLGQENFWPTITATPDHQVWLVDGSRSAIVRLDGLDTIRRLDVGKLTVTPADLVRAEEMVQARESARQRQQGSGVLKVPLVAPAPVVDGNLDDWNAAHWVEIDRRGRENVRAAVAVTEDRLFAAWQTDDARLLTNSGENPNAPFKTGGALDLMIGTNPHADPNRKKPEAGDLRLLVTQVPIPGDPKSSAPKFRTKALLYRAVVPGTPDSAKIPFSSPWRTVHFDQVADVSDQVILAAGKKGDFEISVPLERLALRAVPGQRIRGDIGILRGNGSETTARVYWSNKASAIVSDVPSEAQLTPALWGPWEFSTE